MENEIVEIDGKKYEKVETKHNCLGCCFDDNDHRECKYPLPHDLIEMCWNDGKNYIFKLVTETPE